MRLPKRGYPKNFVPERYSKRMKAGSDTTGKGQLCLKRMPQAEKSITGHPSAGFSAKSIPPRLPQTMVRRQNKHTATSWLAVCLAARPTQHARYRLPMRQIRQSIRLKGIRCFPAEDASDGTAAKKSSARFLQAGFAGIAPIR